MGAYNELILDTSKGEIAVQFKYGLRWQKQYKIGDLIDWGELQRPNRASGEIWIPGIWLPPKSEVPTYYKIKIVRDKICDAAVVTKEEYENISERNPDR